MTLDIRSILKSPLSQEFSQKENGIFEYINPDFIIGDNKKYMGMYDKLARWYDFGEKWIGWLKYGNLIANETADYIDSQYKKAHFLKTILTTQLLIYEKLKTQFLILFTKKIWNLFGTKNFA